MGIKKITQKVTGNKTAVKVVWSLGILLLVVIILQRINLSDFYQLFSKTSPLFITLFLTLSLSISFFKAVSYYLLLKESGVTLSLLRVVRIFSASQVMTFLPGGELGRVVLTKKESHGDNQKAASAVLSQAFVELVSAIIVVLLGSLYFQAFRMPALVSLLVLIVLLIVVLSKRVWGYVMMLPLKIKFLSQYEEPLANIQQMIRNQVLKEDTLKINDSFLKVMLFAFLSHLMGGLLIYAISVAYKLNLNILNSIYAFSLTVLIQGLISVIPGGLGVSDGGLIALLVFFGNSAGKSLALALTFRIVGFFFNLAVGLVVFTIFYRPGIKHTEPKERNG